MMRITIDSKKNSRFKLWKKLQSRKGRNEQRLFLVEGPHLVEEALQAGFTIRELLLTSSYPVPEAWLTYDAQLHQKVVYLSTALFEQLMDTETPQGVAATIEKPVDPILELDKWHSLLLVDEVQDPGNLGSLIRTADAAGVSCVVLGKGTTDPYSGKALRSTQGSIFHLPVIERDLFLFLQDLKRTGWTLIGSALRQAIDYRQLTAKSLDKYALLVGNEGRGIAESLLQSMDKTVKIPIYGKSESLNVGVATGILLYHLQHLRQKSNS